MRAARADVSGHRLGCRQILARRRLLPRLRAARACACRPFKPQNMSNNAAVTADGGEIGRAQALQARACGVAPERPHEPGAAEAAERDRLADRRAGPHFRHRQGARLSGAEAADDGIRRSRVLRGCAPRPISCWSKARAARRRSICAAATSPIWASRAPQMSPVVLIGDIDRGGVIAQIVGTKAVLDPADARHGARLSRQQVSRRRQPVRRWHGPDRASTPAGRRWA